ncbi:MAG: SDR family NAD(P)-dependent oxidoreductase, partial [Chthoniobacteraceae bacterium]
MDLLIADKLAIITGSTAGIGFAIARRLAQEGARVVINGRTEARTEQAVAALRAELPDAKIEGFAADLSAADGVQDLALHYPAVDILVNNLGVYGPKP